MQKQANKNYNVIYTVHTQNQIMFSVPNNYPNLRILLLSIKANENKDKI